jgi:hypothetical protein
MFLNRIRYLFCAFPRIFEVSSVSRSVKRHSFIKRSDHAFWFRGPEAGRDLDECNFLTKGAQSRLETSRRTRESAGLVNSAISGIVATDCYFALA